MSQLPEVCFWVRRTIRPWYLLLQRGFDVSFCTGSSVRSILVDQFGISPELVEKDLRTVFVNGKPVDDIDTATPKDKDVLAIASPMPGLAGITMGRNSPTSGFRADITYCSDSDSEESAGAPGVLTLRLFTTAADRVGKHFLSRGVTVSSAKLLEFLQQEGLELIAKFTVGGEDVAGDAILSRLDDLQDDVRLQVELE